MNGNQISKILIVKLSSMGDVIHALPCAEILKKNLPVVEISWLVEKRCVNILKDNPY